MKLRLALRLVALAPALLVGIPVQMLALRLQADWARRIPRLFHAYAARVLGIKVQLEGAPQGADGGVLYVSNHISWLDILVISAVLPVSFIARDDMAAWPLFGLLARLQQSIFVDRDSRHATGSVAQQIAARLAQGHAIVLFAEGTTGDGHRVLPFRSALVGAARTNQQENSRSVSVRPLALTYTRSNGLPLTRRTMPKVAWYGDMELAPHLAALVGTSSVDALVSLGAPMEMEHAGDRKRVTALADAWVRAERRRLSRDAFSDD